MPSSRARRAARRAARDTESGDQPSGEPIARLADGANAFCSILHEVSGEPIARLADGANAFCSILHEVLGEPAAPVDGLVPPQKLRTSSREEALGRNVIPGEVSGVAFDPFPTFEEREAKDVEGYRAGHNERRAREGGPPISSEHPLTNDEVSRVALASFFGGGAERRDPEYARNVKVKQAINLMIEQVGDGHAANVGSLLSGELRVLHPVLNPYKAAVIDEWGEPVLHPHPEGKAQLDPNVSSSAGMLPLVFAVQQSQLDIARALLDGGADPNREDGDGRTALTAAIYSKNAAAVALLMERGGRFNQRRFDFMDMTAGRLEAYRDFTALDIARIESSEEVVRCLLTSRRGRLLRRLHTLRRGSRHVGRAAVRLLALYEEITLRPGNKGALAVRDDFSAAANALSSP